MKLTLVILAAICGLLTDARHWNDDCESGPTFWCASRENAKRCNAQTYCKLCWPSIGSQRDYMIRHNRLPKDDARLCLQTGAKFSMCHECKAVIEGLDRALKNNQTIESILTAMRFACNFLPAYSTVCRNVVNDLDDMIGVLEPYLRKPELACQKIKLCPSNDPNVTMGSVTSLLGKTYLTRRSVDGNNNMCDDCKEACLEIVAQLQDPDQQESIKETFEALCDFVGPLKAECRRYIDEFVPKLVQWITSLFTNPDEICKQLGFCK